MKNSQNDSNSKATASGSKAEAHERSDQTRPAVDVATQCPWQEAQAYVATSLSPFDSPNASSAQKLAYCVQGAAEAAFAIMRISLDLTTAMTWGPMADMVWQSGLLDGYLNVARRLDYTVLRHWPRKSECESMWIHERS